MYAFFRPRTWLVALLLSLLAFAAMGETLRGTPLLRRYLASDYNASPQHFAIATGQDGRLYVGNSEGVLRYDGEKWDLIQLPGKSLARAVVTGRDNRIYIGSYDTFGWLKPSPDGDLVYEELLTAFDLKGHARDVGNVWQVIATAQGVYFRTEHTFYFLSYDRKLRRSWPLADNVRSFYSLSGELYARVDGKGYCRFEDGHFELQPGGELFAHQPLAGAMKQPGWQLLIAETGLFRADGAGIRPLAPGAGAELAQTRPYTVLHLEDGSFVIGTLTGEMFRYGPDFRLRERVNLGSYGIVALGTDREGGLWAATEGDLVRMSLPSPWSFIGADQGLVGSAFDFEWFDDALWVAGSRGILKLTPGDDGKLRRQDMPWINYEGYALKGTDAGLLIGHRNGLLVLDPGAKAPRTLFQSDVEGASEIIVSRFDPGRAYCIGDLRLFVLELRDGRWQLSYTLPLDGASAYGLIETAKNELWFGDSRGGPQRWTLDPVGQKLLHKEIFGKRDGLELDPHSGAGPYLLDGQVHVVTGDRGYRYDGLRFQPDAGPPFTLVDRPNELTVTETPIGAYAFTSRQLWFRPARQKEWQALHLGSQLAAGYSQIRYNRDGVLRAATWSGLLQFNPTEKQPDLAPLQLAFEYVLADPPDGGPTQRLPLTSQGDPIEIPAGYRLHFRYDLVSMDSALEFRYRLHGIGDNNDTWSEWTDRDLYVRAITPGDYVLEVEARTKSGRLAAPTSYRYRILPMWYQRWWVWLIGALMLLALTSLIVQEFIRRRTQRYLEANRHLESRIAERTHELEEANRKLAEIATEDALTGVNNRRALEQGLQREWFRCLDQRRPLSVLMIDVDHFKRYNDTHGHLEGDVLLRQIAQQLQAQHDPKRELLARYGGEEFALLLPSVSVDEARRRAEAIRTRLQQDIASTTVSIGVAGFVPGVQGETSQLLRRADAALYRAKRAGRNRVEVDEDPPPG